MQGEPGITRTKRRPLGALLSYKTSRRLRHINVDRLMDRFFGKACRNAKLA